MSSDLYILGISAFYHDSAAALIKGENILAAAQEERFTRKKHDHEFPQHAIEYCLQEADITVDQLSAVVFYDKPILKFERILETYLAYAPKGLKSFLTAMPLWLGQKLYIPKEIDRGLGNLYDGPIYFTTHHESHAASAFFPSPFEEAAIITFDGVGEWTTTSIGVGRNNNVNLLKDIQFPHSLGLLYSAFTYYTGFRVNSGEYKVMGLAPYGKPVYSDLMFEHIIDLKADGSFWLDQSYFNYCAGLTMTSDKFHRLFGGPPRKSESLLTQRDMDLAASVQKVVEDIMLKVAHHAYAVTGLSHLCMAGGVALNCVGNGRILRETPFSKVWIQPASGDAGGALGSALFTWYQIRDNPRKVTKQDAQKGSFIGPSFSGSKIRDFLQLSKAEFTEFNDEDLLAEKIARLLAEGKVIGHFAGRMEFGPRALGNRSIIGDPRNPDMQTKMNLKVKFRESFRPFAPSCLVENTSEFFELDHESPYMLLVAPIKENRRIKMNEDQEKLFGPDKLKQLRSDVPAITHIDYSARIQTVDAETSPRFHKIIKAFHKLTGYPLVVNTSFNIRGEPIVGTPQDAYRCFMYTDIDVLILENCICNKEEQPEMEGADEYKTKFKLD
jgi:carbamoyltransferase